MERYGVNPKFGTKKWFENYWFHYKWHTIAGLFALFLVVMFVHDLLTREKFDAQISVNTGLYISQEQQDQLSLLFTQYAEDFDGDGNVNVGVFANTIPSGENADPQMLMAAQTKFMVEISDGESMILILDDDTYAQIGEPQVFADLSAFSDKAYDGGIKIKLADTPIGEDPLIEPFAEKLFITMRAADSHLVTGKKNGAAAYEAARSILQNLISDNKTQQPPAP